MSTGEIVNKVAQSPLITFNLEDFMPANVRALDISEFLDQGFILREGDFREALKNLDYSMFEKSVVRLYCSTDAILPAWAALLVASRMADHGISSYWAPTEEALYSQYFREQLAGHDWSALAGKPVIIKGCGDARIPQDAYVFASSKLKTIAKKISYGEACSAVPLK